MLKQTYAMVSVNILLRACRTIGNNFKYMFGRVTSSSVYTVEMQIQRFETLY